MRSLEIDCCKNGNDVTQIESNWMKERNWKEIAEERNSMGTYCGLEFGLFSSGLYFRWVGNLCYCKETKIIRRWAAIEKRLQLRNHLRVHRLPICKAGAREVDGF